MDRQIFKLILCCAFFSLSGCMAARIKTVYRGEPGTYSKGIPSQYIKARKLLAYPRRPLKVQETIYAKQNFKNYQTSFLRFKSIGQNGQKNNEVSAVYFHSELPGPKKLVVIIPLWGGSVYPSNALSVGILRAGHGQVDVIKMLGANPVLKMELLEHATSGKEVRHLLKTLAIRTKNTIINIQRLINWTLSHKNISRQHVFIMGFSKGAIVTGIVAQIDPQVTDAILVMGAASAADILYTCDYYNTREAVTKNLDWSNAKFRAVVEEYLGLYNVYNFPTRLNPSHVLIFDAHNDKCVSKKNRDDLWLAMGKPTRISFLYTHRISFTAMTLAGGYYMRFKIYEFINKGYSSLHRYPPT